MNDTENAGRAATRTGLSGVAARDEVDGALDALARAPTVDPDSRSRSLLSAGSPDPGPGSNWRQTRPTKAAMLNVRACRTMTGVKGYIPRWNTESSGSNGFGPSGGDGPALPGETGRNRTLTVQP